MPEYLAPGVFVEEVSFRAKSIEGVSTSTTGFVGPTRRGPLSPAATDAPGSPPEVLTSFLDFQRIYGGLEDLELKAGDRTNYLAHAVRAYFDNGGARLFVARVAATGGDAPKAAGADIIAGKVRIVARQPGSGGNGTAQVSIHSDQATVAGLKRAPIGSVVRTGYKKPPPAAPTEPSPFVIYVRNADGDFVDSAKKKLPDTADADGVEILTATIVTTDGDGVTRAFDGMGFDPAHPRFIGNVMAMKPSRRSDQLEQVYAIQLPDKAADLPAASALYDALAKLADDAAKKPAKLLAITGGTDGALPGGDNYRDALRALEAIEDISIVAAPGSSAAPNTQTLALDVQQALISHCERRRAYRIAVLDTRQISTIGDARDDRAPLDSSYAALYTPYVMVANPLYKQGDESRPSELALPPSGFVCGIYARTDIARGVFKAPANEVVRGAIRHDLEINFAQQETLNPIGVNCLRAFPNRGNRVWGARTLSSDPEWKYVNVRRYFNYVERSIDVGTQWAVFEPNGERLWSNIRQTVSDFLLNEWRSGALLGDSDKEAFFVRCDRSTMDQNDLDNGRLVCLIGLAVVKPAEFVVFRIGQKTADARN